MCGIENCSLYMENQVEKITPYSHMTCQMSAFGYCKHFNISFILSVNCVVLTRHCVLLEDS